MDKYMYVYMHVISVYMDIQIMEQIQTVLPHIQKAMQCRPWRLSCHCSPYPPAGYGLRIEPTPEHLNHPINQIVIQCASSNTKNKYNWNSNMAG